MEKEKINRLALLVEKGPQSLRGPFITGSILILAAFLLNGYAWLGLDNSDRIPIHWNLAGEVDGYGSRHALFLLPCLMIFTEMVFWVVPLFEPRFDNLLRSFTAYKAMWIGTSFVMFGITLIVTLNALGYSVSMLPWLDFLIGFLMIVMGNFMGKLRSNHLVGVRTKWTLSSDLSWNKSHRLCGWLFFLLGVSMFVIPSVIRDRSISLAILGAILSLVVIVPIVYSYHVWKNDPNAHSNCNNTPTNS